MQDGIYRVINGVSVADDEASVYAPVWQVSLIMFVVSIRFLWALTHCHALQVAPFNDVTKATVMFNQMSEEKRSAALGHLLQKSAFVVSDIFFNTTINSIQSEYKRPVIELHYPVFRDIVSAKGDVVGALTFSIGLEALLENALDGFEDEPLTAVVQTSCGGEISFMVRGETVEFLGPGNLKEKIPNVGSFELVESTFEQFDDKIRSLSGTYPTSNNVFCSYRLLAFPTIETHTHFLTNRPVVVEMIVGLLFLFTVSVFLGYDCLVERRQRKVLAAVQRSNALVGSLFPQAVRDRLHLQSLKLEAAPKLRLKTFMANDNKVIACQSCHAIVKQDDSHFIYCHRPWYIGGNISR